MAMRQRVLVIDDDNASRRMLGLLLGRAGYAVDEAINGARALERLRVSQESGERLVALVDAQMPVMDGTQLLQAVVVDATLARQHVYILVTANRGTPSPLVASLCDSLQMPQVQRPFDNDDLLAVVAAAAARLA